MECLLNARLCARLEDYKSEPNPDADPSNLQSNGDQKGIGSMVESASESQRGAYFFSRGLGQVTELHCASFSPSDGTH